MKKKNKHLTYILVFLIAVNLTALFTLSYNRLFSQEKPFAPPDPGETVESVRKELGLTPGQIQKLRVRRLSYRQQIRPEIQEIQEKKRVLIEEIRSEKPDMTRINKLIDEISLLQAEIQKKAVMNLLQEKSILDQRQRKHYFSMFERHVCGRTIKDHHPSEKPPAEGRKIEKNRNKSIMKTMVYH